MAVLEGWKERTGAERVWRGRGGGSQALTSANALLLPGQDAGAVDDADALQNLVGQLRTHESGRDRTKIGARNQTLRKSLTVGLLEFSTYRCL